MPIAVGSTSVAADVTNIEWVAPLDHSRRRAMVPTTSAIGSFCRAKTCSTAARTLDRRP